MLSRADSVICLSEEFATYISGIQSKAKTTIIPASIDLETFHTDPAKRNQVRNKLGIEASTAFVYSGGLGSWHDPLILCRLFKAILGQNPNAVLLLISRYSKTTFLEIWNALKLPHERLIHINCPPQQMTGFLNAADWGIVPLQEIPSGHDHLRRIAQTMTGLKVAEYLACGLPIIVNNNIGGVATLLKNRDVGFYFDTSTLSSVSTQVALRNSALMRHQCRQVATELFDVSSAARKYIQVYQGIASI